MTPGHHMANAKKKEISVVTVEQVKAFWESNPLFSGEAKHEVGSKEYFEEHRNVTIDDCMAGVFDDRFLPPAANREAVLDLGCGPGFWTIELSRRAALSRGIVAADLTEQAVVLTRKRANIYRVKASVEVQNAECRMPDIRRRTFFACELHRCYSSHS